MMAILEYLDAQQLDSDSKQPGTDAERYRHHNSVEDLKRVGATWPAARNRCAGVNSYGRRCFRDAGHHEECAYDSRGIAERESGTGPEPAKPMPLDELCRKLDEAGVVEPQELPEQFTHNELRGFYGRRRGNKEYAATFDGKQVDQLLKEHEEACFERDQALRELAEARRAEIAELERSERDREHLEKSSQLLWKEWVGPHAFCSYTERNAWITAERARKGRDGK
jgi:hypothetical protein